MSATRLTGLFWAFRLIIFINDDEVKILPFHLLGLKELIGVTAISGDFFVNKDFKIISKKNIYIPGILSRGFNPERKTIIKAILENSQKVGQSIAKTLIYV